MSPAPTDTLLADARARAASGEWTTVRDLLAEGGKRILAHPELATLRAEAELRTGRPREARDWLAAALPVVERSGDRAALRHAVNLRGVAEVELGLLEDAEITFGRAVELARADGDDLLIARAMNNLGTIANVRGQRAEALLLYQLAIPAYQRLGQPRGLAETYHNMAISYRHAGRPTEADECERQAISYALDAQNASLEALARVGRAELSLIAGDAPLAEAGARHAAHCFGALPDPIREADALRVLAAACVAQQKLQPAREAVNRALTLARSQGARLIEAETLRVQVEILAAAGEWNTSHIAAVEAAKIFESLGALAERDQMLDRGAASD